MRVGWEEERLRGGERGGVEAVQGGGEKLVVVVAAGRAGGGCLW